MDSELPVSPTPVPETPMSGKPAAETPVPETPAAEPLEVVLELQKQLAEVQGQHGRLWRKWK